MRKHLPLSQTNPYLRDCDLESVIRKNVKGSFALEGIRIGDKERKMGFEIGPKRALEVKVVKTGNKEWKLRGVDFKQVELSISLEAVNILGINKDSKFKLVLERIDNCYRPMEILGERGEKELFCPSCRRKTKLINSGKCPYCDCFWGTTIKADDACLSNFLRQTANYINVCGAEKGDTEKMAAYLPDAEERREEDNWDD
jgi:hypothetical protein